MLKTLTVLILVFLVTFSFTAQNGSVIAKPQSAFAPNQLLVKYKSGSSPHELNQLVAKRQEKGQSILGMVFLFYENVRAKLARKDTPEVKLNRLESTDQQAGVLRKTRLFASEEKELGNIFLIVTDGRLAVPELVNLYQNLPEIEFAEPNYLYSTMPVE